MPTIHAETFSGSSSSRSRSFLHATGHIETGSELEVLEEVTATYVDSGYDLSTALVEIVASPAFRVVGEPL